MLTAARTATSILGVMLLTLIVGGDGPGAYEDEPTHGILADRSIDLAVTDARYAELGVKTYRAVIKRAAVDEDAGSRFLNHFFDPSTALGLPQNDYTFVLELLAGLQSPATGPFPRYVSALDWARDGTPDGLDWKGAIAAYDYTTEAKLRAYTALGHVLHLLHDMAQPDHARARPHPCNAAGVKAGIADPVGYETLWTLPTQLAWPRATTPRKLQALDTAFRTLADESKRAEDALGLPMPDEFTLGCGRQHALVEGVRQAATGGIAFPTLIRIIKDRGWTALLESHWQETQVNLPIVPTIPRPPGDARTQKYLTLGRTMLQKAEEYGAGLLRLFHDIVTPPPFVEEVEIQQGGQRKYRKAWIGDETRDTPSRLRGRRAEVEGGELEPGIEASVVIRIGPKDPDRRALAALRVSIVTDAGTPEGTTVLRLTEQGEPTSPRGGVWVGAFTPTRNGTVRIEAMDRVERWADRSGQREQSLVPVGGRRGAQGELDAEPSTPARATWRPVGPGDQAPPGPPYPWVGYEAGADTNHRFTVRGAEECVVTALSPRTLESMAWGTWTGTVRSESDTRDFDRLLSGHRAPHARVFTTRRSETTTDVRFRSGVASDGGPMKFGHGEGTVSVAGTEDRRYGDDKNPVATQRDTRQDSGEVERVDGSLAPHASTGSLRYEIGITGRVRSARGVTRVVERTAGSMCSDRTLTGHTEREAGKPDSWAYSRRVTRWRFTFAPGAPEHVTRFPSSLLQSLGGSLNVAAHEEHVARITDDFLAAQSEAYSRRAAAEVSRLFARLMEVRQGYEQAMDDARRSYRDQQEDILSRHSADARRTHGELSELWLSNEPDADRRYRQSLPQLEQAIAAWRGTKKAIEERYATATERAAAVVQELSPDAARKLRDAAQQLRRDGLAPED